MDSTTNNHNNGQKAPRVTEAAGQSSTSTRIETRQPYTREQHSGSNLLSVQAERQSNGYSIRRWLHQSPHRDPWNVPSRSGGQHSNEVESKRVEFDERKQK